MILTVAPLVAQASPSPTVAPPLQEDSAIDKRAQAWFEALIAGKTDAADPNVSDKVKTLLTPAVLSQLADVGRQGGALKSFDFNKAVVDSGDNVYAYHVTLENGDLAFIFALTPDGKVDGLWIKPVE